ncbi:competence type IV pilus ATPase ComGA [Massilibacterium senegalense]|uniref:competence type IV pilus ATPase ComGA n=1 Tax=Massilibacterium senegalense TaxID=1632858 RepID=UPI00078205AE|nr:competence type IV pilus ATPase ComGA [Massilibacterium senegalense]
MNTTFQQAQFLLKKAVDKGCSDCHIHPFENGAHVLFRMYGKLVHFCSLPLQHYQRIISHFKFLAGMNTGERRIPQSGAFSNADWQYEFRLSTIPTPNGESLVIRLLPQHVSVSFNELFVFSEQALFLKKLCQHEHGLIIVSGPTGSGKSTTVYAMLKEMNRQSKRQIITIEDPIEQKVEPFVQMEVNNKAGMTFHEGLRSVLRHDPDVIFIGEIRDEETAKIAIRSSLTGHLVISTMHAAYAEQVVARFLEFGISMLDIKQTMLSIICQRLVFHPVYKRKAIVEYIQKNDITTLLEHPMKTTNNQPLSEWIELAEMKGWTACAGLKKNEESF